MNSNVYVNMDIKRDMSMIDLYMDNMDWDMDMGMDTDMGPDIDRDMNRDTSIDMDMDMDIFGINLKLPLKRSMGC